MPLNRTPQPPTSVTIQGLRAANTSLKLRCAALQKHVDEQGEEWCKGISSSITTAEEAVAATRQYNKKWFDRNLWSDDVKLAILQELVAVCKSYTVIDVSVWQDMINDIIAGGAHGGYL